MKSLSSIGLGLSVVFGCLLLALIAELYYLLWWKKRFTGRGLGEKTDDHSSLAKELLFMFCWRKPSALSHPVDDTETLVQDPQQVSNKDLAFKPFGDEGYCSIETELMRLQLHNISGPPRFLFTIMEETKEDLESEDGKSRGRSLSDLLLRVETPYLTPMASPSLFTPPLTPVKPSSCQHQEHQAVGFNPLFESAADAEFNRMRASPPPKFKFLQDAEEKLQRRKLVEEEAQKSDGEEDGSFITIVVDKSKERGFSHQFHSATSQVLPLSSSPSTSR